MPRGTPFVISAWSTIFIPARLRLDSHGVESEFDRHSRVPKNKSGTAHGDVRLASLSIVVLFATFLNLAVE